MCVKIVRSISLLLFYTIFYTVVTLVQITPFCLLYATSSFLGWCLTSIPNLPTNKIAQRNFRRVYHLSPKETKNLCRKYYTCFIDYMFEFVKRVHFSDKKMASHCKFKNTELLYKKLEDHNFVICYGGHMVNFEWQVSLPMHTPEIGMCHLYLGGAEKNKASEWVLNARSKYGAINIPTTSPLKTLIKLNQELKEGTNPHIGYVFGTLADMDTKASDPHKARMFDRDFEVMTGSEKIGRKFNMAFVYAHMCRPKRGYYEIEFREITPPDLSTNPFAYTDEFIRMLEQNIHEKPELWMQWGECRF